MKVFVATSEGQGMRKNDFCWTQGGELVRSGFECDGETIDGSCGCKRSMSGFKTSKATTTFKVVNKDITSEEYTKKLIRALEKDGWLVKGTDERWAKELAEELLSLAKSFPVNKVLEKRGDVIRVRGQRTS